jgi:energy-coupling factor transporter transmembrane protein EcfT
MKTSPSDTLALAARFPLHGMDPRLKLLSLVMLSLACGGASGLGLGLLSLLAAAMIAICPGMLRLSLRALRAMLPLLLLVLAARALTTPGEPLPLLGFLSLSTAGVCDGALVCLRLALVTLFGQALVLTTPVDRMRAAVEHLLRPLPFIPEKRIAAMLGLAIQLIPLVLNAVRGTDQARMARCAAGRGNALGRITGLAIPAMRRVFISADQLALAMEARLYTEEPSPPRLRVGRGDWLRFWFVAAASGLTFWLRT